MCDIIIKNNFHLCLFAKLREIIMKNLKLNHISNFLIPCLLFSISAGFLSAVITTLFKVAAEKVIHFSSEIRSGVYADAKWLFLLVLGCAAIGFAASVILSYSRTCRGGGIPTSVAAIKGMVSFNWLASIIVLPFSALLTFLCGLPLGTEGPCVQIGTAVGDGIVTCFTGKSKYRGWRRYIMTGGASAGFSVATGAPITAVIFSIEEIQKRLSPILLIVASISVTTAQLTANFLESIGIGTTQLFHIDVMPEMSHGVLFAPIIIGLLCGLCAILFTRIYHTVDELMRKALKKISIKVLFPILFAAIAVVGFFLTDALGTGHSLVDTLFETRITWYVIVILLLVRVLFMSVSNSSGVTGGVFLPTLAFGAMIGSLCGEAMIALGWIGAEHYTLTVVLGITAFLGAVSRIPITACVFAIEAMGGIDNIIPIIVVSTVALFTVEISGLDDFTDTVIHAKLRSITKGKKRTTVEVPLTVGPNAFVIGKEVKDVLWPHSCLVLSFEHSNLVRGVSQILEGDVVTMYYETYDPAGTASELEILVGKQSEETRRIMNPNDV